ncbi:MAG: phosphotransferase [Roseiflexaceae bacterium]
MLAENYRQIIAACFPELAINRCAIHSEGWDSIAIAVNDQLIFRFPKRSDVEPQYQIERRLLPTLAAALPLPIPDVAFFWPGGAPYHKIFIGHHQIDGVQLSADHLKPNHINGIAQQLGEFLSALHRFPIQQATQLGVPAGDKAIWHQRYQAQFEQIQSRMLPLLDEAARARIVREWRSFLNEGAHFSPTLIHHDLGDEHILYNPARGTVSGIIDWGDTAIGDSAIDFAGLLAAYGEDFTERVLSHYQGEVDAAFRQRMRFYHGAMPINTLLFGLDTAQEQFVRQGLRELHS